MRRIAILVAAAVVALATLVGPASASGHVFQANLTTGAELHEVTGSNANGHAKFTVTDDGMDFTLKVNRLSGPAWGAHIHGPAGPDANAGIVVRLCGAPPTAAVAECTTNANGKIRISGTITADHLAPGVTFADVIGWMEAGMTYVNVHTDLNGAGEVRGQVF